MSVLNWMSSKGLELFTVCRSIIFDASNPSYCLAFLSFVPYFFQIVFWCDEINEPDQPSFKNTPKKLYSYIKSQKNENTGIAPLWSEGTLH
jgi:hypothetical protein